MSSSTNNKLYNANVIINLVQCWIYIYTYIYWLSVLIWVVSCLDKDLTGNNFIWFGVWLSQCKNMLRKNEFLGVTRNHPTDSFDCIVTVHGPLHPVYNLCTMHSLDHLQVRNQAIRKHWYIWSNRNPQPSTVEVSHEGKFDKDGLSSCFLLCLLVLDDILPYQRWWWIKKEMDLMDIHQNILF